MSVLPRPGKSSKRTWPPDRVAAINISSTVRFPTTARSTSAMTLRAASATRVMALTIRCHVHLEISHHRLWINRKWAGRWSPKKRLWRGVIHERLMQAGIQVLSDHCRRAVLPKWAAGKLVELPRNLTQSMGELPAKIVTGTGTPHGNGSRIDRSVASDLAETPLAARAKSRNQLPRHDQADDGDQHSPLDQLRHTSQQPSELPGSIRNGEDKEVMYGIARQVRQQRRHQGNCSQQPGPSCLHAATLHACRMDWRQL